MSPVKVENNELNNEANASSKSGRQSFKFGPIAELVLATDF
jgi:hypothetical protein